jgi:hypothetical protein
MMRSTTFPALFALATTFAGAAGNLAAQDQATTLLAAARAADLVVVASVTGASDPSPEWHRLQFATGEVLRGNAPAQFQLLEPAGACCGRSLFALRTGDQRLLFLQRRGATWHPFGGARGVLAAEPAVIAHVRALLAAPDATALTRLLAQSLEHEHGRVADDAAHALAVLPGLQLRGTDSQLVAAALQQATARGTTRAAALVEVVVRSPSAPLLDAVLPLYLGTTRSDHAALLRRALARGDGETIATRLPQFVADEQQAVRAAELLVELPAVPARAALASLLQQTGHPRLQLCIAEGLLAAGARAEDLAGRIPAPVLELAQKRHDRPRRFRNIDPMRR